MNGDINGNINGGMEMNSNMISVIDRKFGPVNSKEFIRKSLPSEMPLAPKKRDEVDIVINNVVCSFSVRCHLKLREIALNGFNVEYKRESGMVSMKLRHPRVTASIWSSGKITCTGATSELDSKIGARKVARILQKLGFKTKLHNFRVVNVLGTCTMPFGIKITLFTERFKEAEYEPELHPGVTYKLKHLKATMKIYSTGSITITAPSVSNIQNAVEHVYPLVFEFRKERSEADTAELEAARRAKRQNTRQYPYISCINDNSDITNANIGNPTF